VQLLANTTSPYVRIARIALAEKGVQVEPTLVDPWADDPRLRDANAATRVPTLITDDGTPLAESLLIVMWLERTRPDAPSLLGADAAAVLSRAGIALGVIDAAVHTIIIRKVTAPVLFDDTPVGLRRRRTMAEGMQRLETAAARTPLHRGDASTPTLDAICAVVALDYLRFRFTDVPWLPAMPALDALSMGLRERASFGNTMPR
jgi:glutathione S-transferase